MLNIVHDKSLPQNDTKCVITIKVQIQTTQSNWISQQRDHRSPVISFYLPQKQNKICKFSRTGVNMSFSYGNTGNVWRQFWWPHWMLRQNDSYFTNNINDEHRRELGLWFKSIPSSVLTQLQLMNIILNCGNDFKNWAHYLLRYQLIKIT